MKAWELFKYSAGIFLIIKTEKAKKICVLIPSEFEKVFIQLNYNSGETYGKEIPNL